MSALQSSEKPDIFHLILSGSHDLGPLPSDFRVSLVLGLRDPGAARKAADLRALYDPHSPRFGHYQSSGQIARRYGPAVTDVARLEKLITHSGLRASWRRGDDWMTVSGPTRSIDRTFHVQLHWYLSTNRIRFFASSADPGVPRAWRRLATDTGHLWNYPLVQAARVTAMVTSGGLTPDQLLKTYDIQPLRALGLTGRGQTIAFLERDGYSPRGWQTFTSAFHLPPIRYTTVGSGFQNIDGETEMDLEVAHEIAPDARLVIYNENLNQSVSDQVYLNEMLNFERSMVAHVPTGGIISESLGSCELAFTSGDASRLASVYDNADLRRESVFVASGDSGAFTCLDFVKGGTVPTKKWVTISGKALPSVTTVGGTNLSVYSDGSWYAERTWEDPVSTTGTGGGVSAYFRRPYYQQAPGTTDRGRNPYNMHSVPDISADADPATGIRLYINGHWAKGGGTSQAAPIMAGITALIDEYLQQKHLPVAGFLNPALYAMARGRQPYSPFHDVTQGANLWYPATPGYDMATGLGTPDAWNLARDLASYERAGR